MAHDDGDRGWSHSAGGVEHVLDHGPPRHRVEHLWKLRFHPRALARGENHDMRHRLVHRMGDSGLGTVEPSAFRPLEPPALHELRHPSLGNEAGRGPLST